MRVGFCQRAILPMSFFSFPLGLLAMPGNDTDRIQRIVSYCLIDNGRKQYHRMTAARVVERLEELSKPPGYNFRTVEHQYAILGAATLNVTVGALNATITRWRACMEHLEAFQATHGKQPLVFIGSKALWDANAGKLRYRHFSLVCAINSVIGMNRTAPVRITRDMILARAHGYKAPKAFKESGTHPTMTTWQLKDTLNKLEECNAWFSRIAYSPRCTFFSLSLDREAVCKALENRMEARVTNKDRRAADRARFSRQSPSESPPNDRRITATINKSVVEEYSTRERKEERVESAHAFFAPPSRFQAMLEQFKAGEPITDDF